MAARSVVVIGAGMGGLAAALDLARQGWEVDVIERASAPGGKMREVEVGDVQIDGGPTVFTMRWVFEALFADAQANLDDYLSLQLMTVLARHAWRDGGTLDLFANVEQSAAAIAEFAGAREADGYLAFCRRGREIYETLRLPYIASQRPSPIELVRRVGLGNLGAMWRTAPMRTLWGALGDYFHDPRLRQLFGRYATYVGSSPLLAPATLMLIAHVEQDGVWVVKGGMRRIADAVQRVAEQHGARFRFGQHVQRIVVEGGRAVAVELADGERIGCDAVVFNGDASALAIGLLGDGVKRATTAVRPAQRSLSAVTWCVSAKTSGFELHHHNVFFANDYPDEFAAIFQRRDIVAAPTVYVCAQDRAGDVSTNVHAGASERVLVLINAPADGDRMQYRADQLAELHARAFGLMSACGLNIDWSSAQSIVTPPSGFNALFPATGGALYGRANHGSMASFARPGAASTVRGLYLAGGSVHPGPGVPMATLSGRLAAERVMADFAD